MMTVTLHNYGARSTDKVGVPGESTWWDQHSRATNAFTKRSNRAWKAKQTELGRPHEVKVFYAPTRFPIVPKQPLPHLSLKERVALAPTAKLR